MSFPAVSAVALQPRLPIHRTVPRAPVDPGISLLTSEERTETEVAVDLVERIRQGDANAESELIGHYSRALQFFLRRRVQDPALAEDLYQETFRIVLLRLRESGLAQPEKLANFLYRTARNLTIADRRKVARRQTVTGQESVEQGLESHSPSPLTEALQRERLGIVHRLIREIRSPRERQLLYRYYVAEEEKETLCRDLDLSRRHFDRVLFRARQRLKEMIERFEKRQLLRQAG